MKVYLKEVSVYEASQLEYFCKNIYASYFKNYWEGNGLELYLSEQFGSEKLKIDLKSESISYYFILYDDIIVGFIKLNYNVKFKEFNNSCELEKMYISLNFTGKGIGKIVLSKVVDILHKRNIKILFLCVLDINKDAIQFYKKTGFIFEKKGQLNIPDFREEFKGIDRMYLKVE